MPSLNWVYNDNSKYRGVWHVTDKPLEIEDVPATTETKERKHYKEHSRDCKYIYETKPGHYRSTYRVACVCPLQTEDSAIVDGAFTVVVETPAHQNLLGQYPAICNQVDVYGKDGAGWSSWGPPVGKVGKTYTVKVRTQPINGYIGETPPGPVCSRCLAKVEQRNDE